MRDFQRGETVEVYVEVKDQDGTFVDPATSTKVTITDPDSTVQANAQDMTKSAKGKYVYYYALASDAALEWWTALATITDTGSKVTMVRCGFKVVA